MTAISGIMKHELRIMIFVISMILASLFIIHPVYAQTTNYLPADATHQALQAGQLPSSVSPTSPLYTDLLVNNLFHSFSCLAIGQSTIGQPCLTYLQGVPVLSKVNTTGGVLGSTTNLIGMLYQNPPVRTADYLASVGQGLGLVKVANAQVGGSGAAVLNPILSLWQTSRNISYVFMIIIFLVIGLMVMFRNKLNPQTVITAQTALPGLVIGLIMITFSYFLAGLVSDMAFVGTNVVGYYFTAAQNKPPEDLAQKLSGSNILSIMGSLTGIVESGDVAGFSSTVFESLGGEAKKAVGILTFFLSSQFISPLIPGDLAATSPWGLLIKPVVSLFLGGAVMFESSNLLGQLLGLAASLALVYAMLKLLFKLIMTWLTIIFLTITAPFQFLFASLPGRQGVATGWMLSMLGNILIFPAIIAVIYFVAFILGPSRLPTDFPLKVSEVNQIQNNSFTPAVYAAAGDNVVGTDTFPLFGGIKLDFVKILLAFGALMALPAIPDIVTKTVGKAGQAGQMLGQEIMGGGRFGQGYAQRTYQAGIGQAGDIKTGVMGQTQVSADGTLMMSRPGLVRRGTGSITDAAKLGGTRGAGKFVMPWRKNVDIK